MFCHLRHGLRNVPKAACALWIANVAGTPTRRDVSTHAVDGRRTASPPDLSSDVCLIFTKATADYASSRRLLLPDGDTKIARLERVVRAIEVDHLARGGRTKAVLSGFEELERDFGQKSL